MEPLDITKIRKDFPVLKRMVNGKPLVYLDNAATSQKPMAMIKRMNDLYSHEYSRPEEGHTLSREATRAFEATRSKVARLVNGNSSREVVFTRGATEGLNLIAMAYGHELLKEGDEILVTEAEHHSNIVPWLLACKQNGARVKAAPLTPGGDIDVEKLEGMLHDRVKLVSVTHVSNVTGGVQPVREITKIVHRHKIPVVVDGAQAVAHMPVDVRDIGCEFYTGSGHKMGGPSSVGFLWGRADVLQSMPLADGGSNMSKNVTFEDVEANPIPERYEAGEPAFAEVEAWSAAIDYWNDLGLDRIEAYELDLTEYATNKLREIPGVRVLGEPKRRLSVLSFVVEGMSPSAVEKALDSEGIAVRAGKLAAQPMLRFFGVEEAVRASFLFYNTHEEADFFARVLTQIANSKS
ncbi:MAG TPA: aminotransferase class V-fold PLP-dependent enzyme [Nannocystis sp.]